MVRSALLYTLGHADVLRADGSLPESESNEDANRIFLMLESQPIAQNLQGSLILNAEGPQILNTTILGMTIEIKIENSTQTILIAEAVLGSLESFFAAAIEQRIVPHTEKLRLNVAESAKISKLSFEISAMDMTGTIIWPADLSPSSFENQSEIHKFWAEISGHILATCCIIKDAEGFLKKLYADEAVQHRMTMVALSSTSYHRVAARSISRISDWQDAIQKSCALRSEGPALTVIPFTEEEDETESQSDRLPTPQNHRGV